MQGEKFQKMTFLRSHVAGKVHKKSSLSDLKKSERKTKNISKRISTRKVGTNLKVRKGSGGKKAQRGKASGKKPQTNLPKEKR